MLHHNWVSSWAHTAIIPTNSAMDVSAAASSTKIRNMSASRSLEHRENIVPFLFWRQERCSRTFAAEFQSVKNWLRGVQRDPAGGEQQQEQGAIAPVFGSRTRILKALHDRLSSAVANLPLPAVASTTPEQHLEHRRRELDGFLQHALRSTSERTFPPTRGRPRQRSPAKEAVPELVPETGERSAKKASCAAAGAFLSREMLESAPSDLEPWENGRST